MKSERSGYLAMFCLLFCLFALLPLPTSGTMRNVPAEYPAIQSGIDAANAGDTVLVQPGRYVENINFNGKQITVGSLFLTTGDTSYISETIIDGNKNGSVVIFNHGEGKNALLSGFTISNGMNLNHGGGIDCSNRSGPLLEHLIILKNSGGMGAGMAFYDQSSPIVKFTEIKDNTTDYRGGGIHIGWNSDAVIQDVIIKNNYSGQNGGGIYCDGLNLDLNNVVIAGNNSRFSGGGIFIYRCESILNNVIVINNASMDSSAGGIYCDRSKIKLRNVTIADNHAPMAAGGIHCQENVELDLVNSIMWNNLPAEIYFYPSNSPQAISVNYSDIRGTEEGIVLNGSTLNWGFGNIDMDPQFLGFGKFPYQLAENSPCVDAGTPDTTGLDMPETDISENPRIYNGVVQRIDMGAFEYQGERIYDSPPVAHIEVSPVWWGSIQTYFEFDASDSYDTEDQIALLSFRWDWENDGVWDTEYSTESNASHQFSDVGIHTIKMELLDTGGLKDIAEIQIQVYPTPGQTYTVTIETDTSHIVELYEQIALSIDIYSGNVAGKKLEIVNYGKDLPDSVHSGPFFANILGYYSLDIDKTRDFGAILSFAYTDSIILASGILEKNLKIASWDQMENQWMLMETEIDSQRNIVRTRTSHFSLWALADSTDAIFSRKRIKTVPSEYWSIQAAINACQEGDTVLISPGIYYENINFKGKRITVASRYIMTNDVRYVSETIINGNRNTSVVKFVNGEDLGARLIGLTITNGAAQRGGGIICENHSSPYLERLVITDNCSTNEGGGIYCHIYSSPLLLNIELSANVSLEYGGAMAIVSTCNPTVINSAIHDNMSAKSGGAIYCYESSPKFMNVTIIRNTAVEQGGGMYFNFKNSALIANSIIWSNSPVEINFAGNGNSLSISYSDVQPNSIIGPAIINWPKGNIAHNPKFQAFEENPLKLSGESPCINAGGQDTSYLQLPFSDLAGNPRIYDGRRDRVDMGAYEFQGEASASTPPLAFFSILPTSGNTKTIFTFDVSGSTDTWDTEEELAFRWDWNNDGTWDTEFSNGTTFEHKYDSAGIYTAQLEVKDTDGFVDSARAQIKILSSAEEPYSTVLESDTSSISAIFERYAVELKFTQGNVIGKSMTIISYPDVVPSIIHTGPIFGRKIGYLMLESTEITGFSATLKILYSDSTLQASHILERDLEFAFWDNSAGRWKALPTALDFNLNSASAVVTRLALLALTDKTDRLIVNVEEDQNDQMPKNFGLYQNYPNPFNPSTTIRYSVKSFSNVSLSVFNLLGQKICTLVEAAQPPGEYSVEWHGMNAAGLPVPSGMYLYRIEAGAFVETKKMMYLK